MNQTRTTPTVELQRVAKGVRLKLETRSHDATFFERVAEAMAPGFGDSVVQANQPQLCIGLARQCALQKKKLTAYLPRHTAIEVKLALKGYRAEVVLTESAEAAVEQARARGPIESERQPNALRTAAEAVGDELVQTIDDDGGRIDLLVAPALLLPGLSAALARREYKPRTAQADATEAEERQMRARLGAEEGLLLSFETAATVVTAAKLRTLLPNAVIYAVATDTGERDFSRAEPR